jgi:hypothetical protein
VYQSVSYKKVNTRRSVREKFVRRARVECNAAVKNDATLTLSYEMSFIDAHGECRVLARMERVGVHG